MSDAVKPSEIKGCPSGLQVSPVLENDPLLAAVDLTEFETREDKTIKSLDLSLQGVHCSGCVSKIERALHDMPGINKARVNLTTARLNVSWCIDDITSKDIVSTVTDLGFGVTPFIHSDVETHQKEVLKILIRYIAVSGFAAMNVMLLSISVWSGEADMDSGTRHLFHWISALIALPTIAYAGRAFFLPAFQALKNKQTNMDVPISLALILASALSLYETIMGNRDVYFDAAIMLLFLLLIGRYLDTRLRLRTGEAARRLTAMQVSTATRLLGKGRQETVPAQTLRVDDIILIPVGQRIPTDCCILDGHSEIDAQIVSGETHFRQVSPGDVILSGTINVGAPLKARVASVLGNSFLAEITQLVEVGEQRKSRYVRIADRAARAYVPIVHSLAGLTFAAWFIISGDLRTASLNAIAVLIITCPCALGLAVPAVHAVAAGKLFEKGIFARSGDAFERIAKIDHIIFDKTGTLTTGRFKLTDIEKHSPEVLALAGSLALHSSHPLARALHPYARGHAFKDIKETPGKGLKAFFNEELVLLGKADFVGAEEVQKDQSSVWLRKGLNEPIQFSFEDSARDDARLTIEQLDHEGFTQEMLTGDNSSTAVKTASALGLKKYVANVSPRQKMDLVQQRIAEGLHPLMVGDGINDAPALAAATASMSFASATDISRTASDIIVQNNKLLNLPVAIHTARNAHKRVIENLSLAIIYNVCAIPLAVMGLVTPLIAALAMSSSSLIVTLNALRVSTK